MYFVISNVGFQVFHYNASRQLVCGMAGCTGTSESAESISFGPPATCWMATYSNISSGIIILCSYMCIELFLCGGRREGLDISTHQFNGHDEFHWN